jgi:quinone-modifying oxidoreductase, subunit QmoC
MAIRVKPELIDNLVLFGAEDVQMCYHCGDCSAVCPHTDEIFRFPRKSMRSLQMGLERKIENSLEPWLCYYCGQCSEQCPREAHPGETMMSLRRWLISRYDFTGIARQFFKSRTIEILAIALVALLTGGFLLYYGFTNGSISVYDGPNAFLPSHFIHKFDLIIGLVLLLFLVVNAARMWLFTIEKNVKTHILLWYYIKHLYLFPWHFFTQKRYAECEAKRSSRIYMPWIIHLGLMLGYVIMLVLVMIFLVGLQSGPNIYWPIHIFGYLASIGLIAGSVYFIRSRLTKSYIQYQKSHSTDWAFVILLLIITISGIFQHLFHRTGLLMAANITYIIHLMAVVPWLLRMPFSKWAHLVYRPLAMYLAAVKRNVYKDEQIITNNISFANN